MSSRIANTSGAPAAWSSLIVLALLTVAACGGDTLEPRTVLVSAAASLTDVFTEMETAFEQNHPVDVVLNFAGSSTLREQILEGAPVDVFASANVANMEQVAAAVEIVVGPVVFARNLLQIAVPRGNPGGVEGLGDFAEEDLLVGLCAEPVPCGALAREVLDDAGVIPAIDTNEPDVRSLLTKIEAGELDAGITYSTDVAATRGSVEGIEIPDQSNVVVEYPIAVISGSHETDATAFVDFVLSDDGQALLREYGFIAP